MRYFTLLLLALFLAGYGSLSYLAFRPSSEQAGHDYEVTVTGVRTSASQTVTVTYTVQLIDCTQY